MSKILAFLFLATGLLLPVSAFSQVMKKAETLSRGDFAVSGSPTVYMDNGVNDIALFVYGLYGLNANTNLRIRAGFFESENYIGANFEWQTRRALPLVTFSLGGHYLKDPAVDLTINLTAPFKNGSAVYGGFDADLIFDDNPDLPLWIFLGYSYHLLNHVDMLLEFNYGIDEVAAHALASGFVFYF